MTYESKSTQGPEGSVSLFPPREPWELAARAVHAAGAASCPSPDCVIEQWPCRLLPSGMRLHVEPMIYNYRLTIANQLDAATGWTDAWCFDRTCAQDALTAFLYWDGVGDPPGLWKKHVTTGRRGPGARRPTVEAEELTPERGEILSKNEHGDHVNTSPVCAHCVRAKAEQLLAAIRRGDFGSDVADLNDEQLMQIFLGAGVFMSDRLPGTESERTQTLFRAFALVHMEAPQREEHPEPGAP